VGFRPSRMMATGWLACPSPMRSNRRAPAGRREVTIGPKPTR
jgi:hypothetical protein